MHHEPPSPSLVAPPSTAVESSFGAAAMPRRILALRVLVVCTANHCRSPLAAALLAKRTSERGIADHVVIDSAALRPVRLGQPPSRRVIEVGRRRGAVVGGVATLATPERLASSDVIVCMDEDHREEIERDLALAARPGAPGPLVRLLLSFAPELGRLEVPDPHGRDLAAHERVAELIERGVEGLAAWLAERLG